MSKTILIADSGSTKTDWRLIQKDGFIVSYSSIGLNPYFIDSEDLLNILQDIFEHDIASSIDEVYFYGAGCSNSDIIKPFESTFEKHFANAFIEINHDLLAAARALFHREKGLAIILGTGSNSCIYDGASVVLNIPALGYILGDEGSGAYLGKQLVIKYIYNELNSELTKKLNLITSKEKIVEQVYKKPFPNKYLASFSSFIAENIRHSQIRDLVKQSLDLFFEKHVLPYPNYQDYDLGIVGSIGFVYQDILQELTTEKGLNIKNIVRSPIEDLVSFHLS